MAVPLSVNDVSLGFSGDPSDVLAALLTEETTDNVRGITDWDGTVFGSGVPDIITTGSISGVLTDLTETGINTGYYVNVKVLFNTLSSASPSSSFCRIFQVTISSPSSASFVWRIAMDGTSDVIVPPNSGGNGFAHTANIVAESENVWHTYSVEIPSNVMQAGKLDGLSGWFWTVAYGYQDPTDLENSFGGSMSEASEFKVTFLSVGEPISEEIVADIEITGSGGIEFSGGLDEDTFVISKDASGLYTLVKNQRYDKIYTRNSANNDTQDVKIPDPFIKSFFFGG
jgi:hypothetical protein